MSLNGMNSRGQDNRSRQAERRRPKRLTIPKRNDSELIGPELPKERDWLDVTREWWDGWRRSDYAPFLDDVTWMGLLSAALVKERVWSGELSDREMVTYLAEGRRQEDAVINRVKERLVLVESDDEGGFSIPRMNFPSWNLAGVDYEKLVSEVDEHSNSDLGTGGS